MADKKPTTKAHRGFIHIPRRRRQLRRAQPIQIGPDGEDQEDLEDHYYKKLDHLVLGDIMMN